MKSNLEKYKTDLNKLIDLGNSLLNAIQYECFPELVIEALKKKNLSKKEQDSLIENLPNFLEKYQTWYSETLVLIKVIIPDRLANFISYYEKPKNRKEVTYGNYVIEDYLQGLRITRNGEQKVGPSAAIPQFRQQVNILFSLKQRFESTLFDIKQLAQADLFDSELDSAKELSKNKFYRAAGAIAGVVLEKHLSQVTENHNLVLNKKNPTINDYNEFLKQNEIIEMPQWRFIQHLGDLRNLCDHNKKKDPTSTDIEDLINGVEKTIKTLF
jgi:hypothetical protein